jgi:hypothetical protein
MHVFQVIRIFQIKEGNDPKHTYTVSKAHQDTPHILQPLEVGINYIFPEWINKELDKILGTLHFM